MSDDEYPDLGMRAEQIALAVEMIAEQAKCSRDEALTLLSRLAVDTGETLAAVARSVLDGDARFDQ